MTVRMRWLLVAALCITPLVACGDDSSSNSAQTTVAADVNTDTSTTAPTSTTTSAAKIDEAVATPEITAIFVKFFDGTNTDNESKLQLLEDPEKLRALFEANHAANADLAARSTATVTKVEFTGDTTADVTYTVNLDGQPALENFLGSAVLIDGTWKMTNASFCDVTYIGQAQPAACVS